MAIGPIPTRRLRNFSFVDLFQSHRRSSQGGSVLKSIIFLVVSFPAIIFWIPGCMAFAGHGSISFENLLFLIITMFYPVLLFPLFFGFGKKIETQKKDSEK